MTTDTKNLPLRQSSPIGKIGMKVQATLQGPQTITWPEVENRSSFYGWSTLYLQVISPTLPSQTEVRSIYANLTDGSQEFVVLRAVYWDWKKERRKIREQKENYELVFPARFVKLPNEKLNTWLSTFTGRAMVDEPCLDNNGVPIRGLRIERDYTACKFEKVWQGSRQHHIKLNQQWDQVWLEMTEALQTMPTVAHLREDFWLTQLDVNYDFETYQPERFRFD